MSRPGQAIAFVSGMSVLTAGLSFGVSCSKYGEDPRVESPTDGGSADVSTAATDSSGVVDAPSSQDGGSDASGFIPCAKRPEDPRHFCDDFDSMGSVDSKWSTSVTNGGGALAPSTTTFRSPPRGMTFSIPSATTPTQSVPRIALLNKNANPIAVVSTQSIRFAAAMHFDLTPPPDQDPTSYLIPMSMAFATTCNNEERVVQLLFSSTGRLNLIAKGFAAECADAGPDYAETKTTLTYTDFLSQWRRVEIVVSQKACSAQLSNSARLVVDGEEKACLPLVVDPFSKMSAFAYLVGIAVGWSQSQGAATMTADNVTLDLD